MTKTKVIIYAPVDVYSGYSSNSRDKVKSLIEIYGEQWDIKIISCAWGSCSNGFIKNNPEWQFLNQYILPGGQLTYQPDIFIWITIPSEFQKVGKFNIGITAGIESTLAPSDWIEGINRMDLTLVSSNHAKQTFLNSKFEKRNSQTNVLEAKIEVNKPIEVVFEGLNLDVYKPILPNIENPAIKSLRDEVKEDFNYLFVSSWISHTTPIGEDRKNVSLLVKSFLETFKNKKDKPGLILKTSLVNSSYMDRDEILKQINKIKNTVNSKDLPNIYLLHGEFTDLEMNEIYNHPKVKAMINLTKGEGFGRTLLEFTQTKKPIITTGWSGHIDFLNKDFTTLIGGTLTNIHPSSANKWLLKESQWFSPDLSQVGHYWKDVFENYKNYVDGGKRQAHYSKVNFSMEKMKEKLKEILDKNIPEFPVEVPFILPKLEKIK